MKLVGLFSSRSLIEPFLASFWFDQHFPEADAILYKYHQMFVAKRLCLKLESDLLSLVSKDLDLQDLSQKSTTSAEWGYKQD